MDGAFGLFAAASPRLAHLTRGIERAESVAADGHKWLNVSYDCAFAAGGAYLTPGADAGWDPLTHVPKMSRRFRGLAAWCALRAYGRDGYRALVERCVGNAATFASWVDAAPGLELMAPAPLIIVCFRYAPAHLRDDPAATDAFNREAVAALQADGRAFVTGTAWNGRAAIRAAFDNWATGPADVAILQEAVREIGERALTAAV